jgi:hypothetical protein
MHNPTLEKYLERSLDGELTAAEAMSEQPGHPPPLCRAALIGIPTLTGGVACDTYVAGCTKERVREV